MPLNLQMLFIGAATVIDTALLLSLLERRNLRNIATPVVTLLFAAWLFHGGEFARRLLLDARGSWAESGTWLAMSTMSAGLLLMPGALLHGVLRLWRSGAGVNVRPNWGYAVAYTPLLLLPWVTLSLAAHPGQPFLDRVAPYVTPVTFVLCAVNVLAIFAFLRLRRIDNKETQRFLLAMAVLLAGVTGLLAFAMWVAEPAWLTSDSPLLLAVLLSPLAPTLLFAYFVIRYRFMQLLLERTFVYGTILAGVVLLHWLIVAPANQRLEDRFQVDFGIIEGIGVIMLILLYPPTRRRVAEALRYLLGRNVADLREQTRRMAVGMWTRLHDDPQTMVDWFVATLRESFEIQLAGAWIFDLTSTALIRSGDVDRIPEEQVRALHEELESHAYTSVDGRGIQDPRSVDMLRHMQASLAVRLDHAGFSGLLVLGPHARAREYGEEELNAVLLLVELLGSCLHNHYLQARRLEAERLAARNEKLSALGMLTSCLAHEIKNPLSSIKTIATVLGEQLGAGHAHAEDVRLILGEVERLAATTGQFLKFARPATETSGAAEMGPVVEGAVQVLGGLARGKDVRIDTTFDSDLPTVAADENTLREIMFNLLLNAIEAVERGGHVGVDVRRNGKFVVMTVRDDGPGIASDTRQRLFAPFVTSKPTGTGLGLFIVRRHIEQLGGEIACDSEPGKETCFTIKLPIS